MNLPAHYRILFYTTSKLNFAALISCGKWQETQLPRTEPLASLYFLIDHESYNGMGTPLVCLRAAVERLGSNATAQLSGVDGSRRVTALITAL